MRKKRMGHHRARKEDFPEDERRREQKPNIF